jgi:RNA polymerase primary sigma factor
MAKEVQSDEVNKLISLGEEKGFLTYDDVNDALLPDVTSAEQLDDIITLFGEKNIDIIDTEQGEKLTLKKSMKEITDVNLKEPWPFYPVLKKRAIVKMYLREMGSVSLLSREGEVKLPKGSKRARAKPWRRSSACRFHR